MSNIINSGTTIGIAGFGHLGSSIARALINGGLMKKKLLLSCRGSEATLARAEEAGLSSCMVSTERLFESSDIILLAARPQDLHSFSGLSYKKQAYVLSFMAGLPLELLRSVITAPVSRVMVSGPETITDGMGLGVSFPESPEAEAVLAASGIERAEIKSEAELDAFTTGICLPPVLQNISIPASEAAAALEALARRFPVYEQLAPWIDKVVRKSGGAGNPAALANVSTKGGVTEAITTALASGASFEEAVEAGLRRNSELAAALQRSFVAAAD